MEHEHKENSPYKGFGVQIFFYLLVPTLSFLLFNWAITQFQGVQNKEQNFLSAMILALLIGFLFTSSTFIAGVAKQPFQVLKDRMAEFVQNAKLSLGFAFENYFYDMRKNGVVFLVYFSIFFLETFFLVKFAIDYYLLYWA